MPMDVKAGGIAPAPRTPFPVRNVGQAETLLRMSMLSI